MEILDRVLFDGITIKHVIGALAALVVIFWIGPTIFRRKEVPDVYETVRCLECGWAGQVSKYHRTCRKCNSTTLEKIG